jgi:peroxiredoxin
VDAKQALQIYQKIDSISRVTGKKQAVIANNWIDPHPGSFLNSYIIYQMLRPYISDDSLKKRVNELSGMATKNSWGRELRYIINHTIKGAKAPHFKHEDTSSNKHSLEEFTGKGNYIFIDFWASWCGPCRHQNPSLRRIYSDFKNKNLTMIGISLDKDKESWVKAIQKDNLQWLQLSDLQFQNNKAAKAFYINSIPSNFLLDPAGKIIARNLTTNELRERLSQLLQ